MVSSMRGNASDGKVEDGKHVASKGEDVGDNGGMTCGAEVLGGVEISSANRVNDVDGDNIVSLVE